MKREENVKVMRMERTRTQTRIFSFHEATNKLALAHTNVCERDRERETENINKAVA